MEISQLARAVDLAKRRGHLLIATVSPEGMPHIATAAGVSLADKQGFVEVTAWFCPMTWQNLQESRAVSLVVWEPNTDKGYQLLGEADRIKEHALLDGFVPGEDTTQPLPQVEYKLTIRVERVLSFTNAPHSDTEPV